MHFKLLFSTFIFCLSGCNEQLKHDHVTSTNKLQLLVKDIPPSPLKKKLTKCLTNFNRNIASPLSIGHRGAPLHYPEHTKEGYIAASKMGAGMMECDVALTKDAQLICRHSHAGLHRTTDVLLRPNLSKKCTQPFMPADSKTGVKATAQCRTTDFNLNELKTLKGKLDNVNPEALTAKDYVKGILDWRSATFKMQYAGPATLLSHKESIKLFKSLGLKMIPELKRPSPIDLKKTGLTQREYADIFVQDYIQAGIQPENVYLQTGLITDIEYWKMFYPAFSQQAVFVTLESTGSLKSLSNKGVRILAPIYTALINTKGDSITLSDYAKEIKRYGFKVTPWTFERNYSKYNELEIIDTLYQQLDVIGFFSDWPATTSFYANCITRNPTSHLDDNTHYRLNNNQ